MYFNESLDTGETAIRAVDDEGVQIWRRVLPGYSNKVVALDDGGVLVEAGNELVKLSSTGDTRWVHADGRIGAVGPEAVYVWGGSVNEIRVLDEATGALRYAVALTDVSTLSVRGNPSSSYYLAEDCAPFDQEPGMPPFQLPASYGTIVVTTSGTAYLTLQLKTESFVSDTSCASSSLWAPEGNLTTSLDTYLIELRPDAPGPRTLLAHDEGEAYVQDVSSLPAEYFFQTFPWNTDQVVHRNLYAFAPDGAGGLLLTMAVASDDRTEFEQTLLTRLVDGAPAYVVSSPDGRLASGIAISESGSALLTDRSPAYGYGYVTAVDQETGLLQWSVYGDLLSTTEDGGAILQAVSQPNYDHTSIIRIDSQGISTTEVVELPDFLLDSNPQYLDDGALLT
jgi:hypothetical protein